LETTLDAVLDGMIAGQRGIGRFANLQQTPHGAAIGGDLSTYNVTGRVAALRALAPKDVGERLSRLVRRSPWSVGLTPARRHRRGPARRAL
jgi:hypothetical protein